MRALWSAKNVITLLFGKCHDPTSSILEAKPLHQGQKTRILGRGSQSCSHLYSTLPVPSHVIAIAVRCRWVHVWCRINRWDLWRSQATYTGALVNTVWQIHSLEARWRIRRRSHSLITTYLGSHWVTAIAKASRLQLAPLTLKLTRYHRIRYYVTLQRWASLRRCLYKHPIHNQSINQSGP